MLLRNSFSLAAPVGSIREQVKWDQNFYLLAPKENFLISVPPLPLLSEIFSYTPGGDNRRRRQETSELRLLFHIFERELVAHLMAPWRILDCIASKNKCGGCLLIIV